MFSRRFGFFLLLLVPTVCCIAVFPSSSLVLLAADDKYERGRMEDIMDVVAKDIQKNFYDANLKGVDWKGITEKARDRIRHSEHLGDMLASIASVPYQLYDSHTYFIPPGRSAKVDYGFEAEPFAKDILVYKLRKDGPALNAGLQLGDKIVAMNGFAVKRDEFFVMSRYFEFLNPSSEMQLEVVRGDGPPQTIKIPAKVGYRGKTQFIDYNEIRREIDAQEPIYKHENYDGNIGYLKLRVFLLHSGDVDYMVSHVKQSSAVIIDLRGNGGGAIETLKALAGSFTDQPYEMAKQVGREKTDPLEIKPSHTRIAAPLFVMVDSSSASAAEMFARDMQIRKRAIVIGDNSSGRVNESRIFWEKVGAYDMVGFGTEIAVSRVVMSNGEELEGRGVTPDETCIPTTEDLRRQRDPCLERTLQLARNAAKQSHPSEN